MIHEHQLDTDEVQLNYAAGPAAGPPLVLFHGVTRCWQDFLPLMPVLGLRWQIYALDFRGHGGSSRCPGHYLVRDHVRDAVTFLRNPQRQPAVLFGHSLGALVALGVAAEFPDAVRAVILEDPPSEGLVRAVRQTPFYSLFAGMRDLAGRSDPVPTLAQKLADIRLPGLGGADTRLGELRDAASIRFMARSLQHVDPDVLTSLLEGRWLEGYDTEQLSRRVRCPVLLLRADETVGGMLPAEDGRRLASWLADCTTVEFAGIPHLIHTLATEAALRVVVAFLESL